MPRAAPPPLGQRQCSASAHVEAIHVSRIQLVDTELVIAKGPQPGCSSFRVIQGRTVEAAGLRSDMVGKSTVQALDKIRVGIIGAGGNTKLHHIPKLQAIPGVEVVKIANRSEESASKVCKELGVAQATGNWRDVIDDTSLNAVVVGTWPYLHKTLVLEALQAGKHVLTEARLAMDASEAKEMYHASLGHPTLVSQVVPSPFTFEYDATVQDIVKKGVLGELLYIEVRALSNSFAEKDGAPLTWRTDQRHSGLNIGVLGIFYEPLQRWVGDAVAVQARAKTVVRLREDQETGEYSSVHIPDHLAILARSLAQQDREHMLADMAIGAQAHVVVSSVIGGVPGFSKGYVLYGKEGTLFLDLDAKKLFLTRKASGGQREELAISEDKKEGWKVEEEFVAAIRKQGSIRRTTFEQGVRYMEFTEAVTRSIQSGCTVRLPLV